MILFKGFKTMEEAKTFHDRKGGMLTWKGAPYGMNWEYCVKLGGLDGNQYPYAVLWEGGTDHGAFDESGVIFPAPLPDPKHTPRMKTYTIEGLGAVELDEARFVQQEAEIKGEKTTWHNITYIDDLISITALIQKCYYASNAYICREEDGTTVLTVHVGCTETEGVHDLGDGTLCLEVKE